MTEYRGHSQFSWFFMLFAFILFLIAALISGGVISGSLPWLIAGGLTAMALSFLVGW
jgi:hypothetical protein